MSKSVVFTIALILWLLLACVSMGADEKGKLNKNEGSLLVENNSPYEILHLYYMSEYGDYEEFEYTAKGNRIQAWDSVDLGLAAGDYYLLAEYEYEGEIYATEQYISMTPGKSYGWEITEALWTDYDYGASYDYMDYGYLAYGDYGYLAEEGY